MQRMLSNRSASSARAGAGAAAANGATRLAAVALLSGALVSLLGCGDDDGEGPPPQGFEIDVSALAPLDPGKGHYEAWIGFPEQPKTAPAPATPLHGGLELISIGKFEVDGAGGVFGLDGEPVSWLLRPDRDPNFAAEGWISIETEGDNDTIPGGLLLAGAFTGSASRATATLTCGFSSIFDRQNDVPLASLTVGYELETPSDADTANEANGIYFSGAGTNPILLMLPPLDGESIVYEGWIGYTYLPSPMKWSTGRFTRLDALDSDSAGYGGAGGVVTLHPGQEFVTGPTLTLNGGVYGVSVSLEPADDNDPDAPSQFVLLADSIPAGHPVGTGTPVANVTHRLPTATFVINR